MTVRSNAAKAKDSDAFLFVNESGLSQLPSGSKGKTQSLTVNRHVQLSHSRRKRERLRNETISTRILAGLGLRLKDSTNNSEDESSSTLNDISLENEKVDKKGMRETPEQHRLHQQGHGHTVASPKRNNTQVDHLKASQIIPKIYMADSIDPFNCTAIPLDSNIKSILQYFVALSIPASFKGEIGTDTSSKLLVHRHVPAIQEVVRASMFNNVHMYSLLAATTGRMKYVTGVEVRGPNSNLFFIHKALQCVQSYLNASKNIFIEKQLVLDVFYLCVAEWYLQNYGAALTHLRAVAQLMKILDNESIFDRYMRETACYNDIFLSVETSTPPLVALTWDPGPLSIARQTEIEHDLATPGHQRMGRGFNDILTLYVFSPIMNVIIRDMISWIDVVQHIWHFPNAATPSDTEWMSRKGRSLLHRLLSIPAVPVLIENRNDVLASRYREESLRYTLIILLSYLTTQMFWRSGNMNMARLQQALVLHDKHSCLETTDHETQCNWGEGRSMNRLLLWILMFGASTASSGTREEEWFMNKAVDVAKRLELESLEGVFEVQNQFFYLVSLQDATMRKFAVQLRYAENV